MLNKIVSRKLFQALFSSQKAIQAPKKFSETISKSRAVMPLYQLNPSAVGNSFIAPNATLVGEIYLGRDIAIGHGSVLRGDINSIIMHQNIIIGDNCVIHTAASLPNGMSASVEIKARVIVQPGCTLYSCQIEYGCLIGANSVILEGAKLEDGAILLPNSVVPPGRVVPANQVWGGNPIKFIRYAQEQQTFATKLYIQHNMKSYMSQYKYQFLPHNSAYLYKPSSPDDQPTCHQYLYDVDPVKTPPYDPQNCTY